jgi:hypothetical protein
MKYKFTKVEDSEQPALRDALSLLTHGTDTKGEFVKVSDALNMPNAGSIFKRAIEEIILAPIQPNLVGSRLVRTTFMENVGRTVSVRALGAVDRFDFSVAEEGEYPEISAATGNGSMVELRFAKYGCKFKISEELLEYSTWDLISYQIQQVAAAMARFRDGEIFKMIFGRGLVVFDNLNPNAAVVGRPGNILNGNGLYTLCSDRFGDLWTGSYSGGVDLAIPMKHTLEYITHEYLNNQSLIDNCVNDVFQSRDGKIWYATDKGVSVYDAQTRLWHHGLYNKVALTICQTVDGRILVGTYGNGVYQVHADGTSMPAYSVETGMLKSDYVFSLFTDSDGNIWVGCLDGDMACFPSDKYNLNGTGKSVFYLPVNEVQCITESLDKRFIAVGTSHGGYLIDKREPLHPRRFFYPEQYPEKDINLFVNSMAFQDSRHIWIGTDGGGLYDYDFLTKKFKRYTNQDALPSNTVYGLIKGINGNLWISTDKGLAFMKQGKIVNLNIFKGMEREYNRMSVACTSDGRVLFGSNDGVVALTPMFAKGLNYAAPLRIHSVEVEGVERSDYWNECLFEMLKEGKLKLSHNENTLVVSFESLYYTTVSSNFMNYYMQFICNKLPFNFVATYIIDSNSRTISIHCFRARYRRS